MVLGLIFVIVAIALLSKVFIQRAGRHIFNPSALGIALIGVTCYLAPDALRYVDIAHALNTPPNMFEAILLLGLIAQLRAPIVLVSVSAAVVQYLAIAVTGGEALIPSVHWAPVTLAIVLLATDPATIPRTGLGRVLFGALYAALMIGLSLLLESNGISDFFTKVIPIPICNALAPVFDRLHGDVEAAPWSWLNPQHNRAHIGVWLFVMLAPWFFIGGKANLFEGRFHPLYGTPHIRAQGPVARCEDNPAFCAPFTKAPHAMRKSWSRCSLLVRLRGFGFRGDGGPLVRWSNLASRAAAARRLDAAIARKESAIPQGLLLGGALCYLWPPFWLPAGVRRACVALTPRCAHWLAAIGECRANLFAEQGRREVSAGRRPGPRRATSPRGGRRHR